MHHALFALGLLLGIGGAVIVAAGVVLAAMTAFAWLKAVVVILRARIDEQPANRAPALTTFYG